MSRLLVLSFMFLCTEALCQPAIPDFSGVTEMYESMLQPPLLERSRFLDRPAILQVSLSPDSKYLVYSLRDGLKSSMYLMDTATRTSSRLLTKVPLVNVYWTADGDNIIVDLGKSIGRLPVGNENHPGYITTLDPAKGDVFLGPDRPGGDHVLVVRRTNDRDFVLERYSLSGESEQIVVTPKRIRDAVFSSDGSITIVMTDEPNGPVINRLSGPILEKLSECQLPAAPIQLCRIVSVDAKDNVLWLTTNSNDNFVNMNTMSLATGELKVFHRDPDGRTDLRGWEFLQGRPVVLRYFDDFHKSYGMEPAMQASLDYIRDAFPGSNVISSPAENGNTWLLVQSGALLQFPKYYLFDSNTRQITPILEEERNTSAGIDPAYLSGKIPFEYHARDGMVIHAYVSLPKGTDISQTPMITLAHGGPFARQYSDYFGLTQFLVNRGYIVYEPNFRISSGYGKEYITRGNRDYGNGVIQQDILDGLEFLLSHDIGNREKLGITGGSFGGFAVLTALAYTPDLFRAGFAIQPPAEIGTTIRYQMENNVDDIESPMAPAMAKLVFGDYDDPEVIRRLQSKSPKAALPEITSPLLVITGGSDRNVPVNQVKEFSLELLNLDKKISLLIDEDKAHGTWPAFETSAIFALMEEFFSNYLGGRRQSDVNPELQLYITDNLLINNNPDFLQSVQH